MLARSLMAEAILDITGFVSPYNQMKQMISDLGQVIPMKVDVSGATRCDHDHSQKREPLE